MGRCNESCLLRIGSIAALCLTALAPAYGGPPPGPRIEAGLYAGVASPDDVYSRSLEPGRILGARFGYAFTSGFGMELSFQEFSSDYSGGWPEDPFHVASFRVNLLGTFQAGRAVRIHLTVGGGLEDTSESYNKDYGLNAGFGLRGTVWREMALRLDLRYCWVEAGSAHAYWSDSVTWPEVTLGVSWLFGE